MLGFPVGGCGLIAQVRREYELGIEALGVKLDPALDELAFELVAFHPNEPGPVAWSHNNVEHLFAQ
jgi:hypothetical protein